MKKYLVFVLMVVLVLSVAFIVNASEVHQKGNWFYQVDEDPMTNEKSIFLSVIDEETQQKDLDPNDMKSITIRKIVDNPPEFYVSWGDYLADNNFVRWKFDDEEIQSGEWNMGESSESLFYPGNSSETMSFVKKLLKSERIVIEARPYSKTKEAAVFKTTGLGEVIKPYLDIFGWEELKTVINN